VKRGSRKRRSGASRAKAEEKAENKRERLKALRARRAVREQEAKERRKARRADLVQRRVERREADKEHRAERRQQKRLARQTRLEKLRDHRAQVRANELGRRRARREREHVKEVLQRDRAKLKAKRDRRRKKEGEPLRARRPRVFYLKEVQAAVRAQNPTLAQTEIWRKIHADFAALSPDAKKKYEDLAVADSKRAEEERAAWLKAQPVKVKKPLSGYMKFVVERRPALIAATPNAKFADLGRALGNAWRALTDAERDAYKAKA